MNKRYKVFNAGSVYIAKTGTLNNYYQKECYQIDKNLYEAVLRDFRNNKLFRNAEIILWMILANNADGFEYIFSESYFLKHWGIGHDTAYHAKKKLVSLGYLVPVTDKPYNYLFYADANGKLWERDIETKKKYEEMSQEQNAKNLQKFQKWIEKKEAEKAQQLEKENKKTDEE